MEHRLLYDVAGHVPAEPYMVLLGLANLVREGCDVTVVTSGFMVRQATEAADELGPEVSVEVIDLRTLVSLDKETILRSLRKMGRLVVVDEDYGRCGFSAGVAALAAEKGFRHLEAPISKVATPNVPIPYSPKRERHIIPNKNKILRAIRSVVM